MMTREEEAKKFIEEVIDDTLENIYFKLSMDTDYSFEEIDALVEQVWQETHG